MQVLALIKTSVQPMLRRKDIIRGKKNKTKQNQWSQGIRCTHGVKEAATATGAEEGKVAKAARSGRWEE